MRELEPWALLLREVPNHRRNHELLQWPPSDICVVLSLLAAQESWTDPSAGRGGLQKKKVSFQLQYVCCLLAGELHATDAFL